MTTKEWKRIARLLKQVYLEIEEEAIKTGINILSPEYDELINVAREKVLTAQGYTLEEYRKAKAKVSGFTQADLISNIEENYEKIEELENRHIPTEEEIALIAEEVAEDVAKKYIVPPVVKNEIIKEYTVEKPRIIETTRVIKERYDDTKINKRLDEIKTALKTLKIPEPYDDTKLKEYFHDYFSMNFKKNIDILGMPDFRKLAMGLQQQIDNRIIGVGTLKVTVSATEPTSPNVGDLWVQTS